MDRIKILDETLWPQVPKDVIIEAERAAQDSTVWIARQGFGHIVAMDGPALGPFPASHSVTWERRIIMVPTPGHYYGPISLDNST